nr:tetraacyldisaccharide 4'-kinase [Gemmatimonadaceae bacterium]
EAVRAWAARVAPGVPSAVVHLVPDALVRADAPDDVVALASMAGDDVLAVAGIGDPHAFAAQLAQAGLRPTLRAFEDHHPYDDADVAALGRAAGDRPVVTTLKDAVKLSPRWPRTAPPLRYVSQRVVVEDGGAALDGALAAVLAARVQSPVVPAD